MTDEVRTLVRRAAAGTEPPSPFDLGAVVRGGRARVRRRRLGTGAGVVALAAVASLVLPSSPVSVLDGEVARTPGPADRPEVTRVVMDDPVKSAVWQSVQDALPDDVGLAVVDGDPVEPGLALQLQRDGVRFAADVLVYDIGDDGRFRLCGQFGRQLEVSEDVRPCVEAPDDHGHWQAIADVLHGAAGLSVLEDGTVGAMVTWDLGAEPTLSRDEVTAVTEAVLPVAAGRSAEWQTGLDLDAVAEGWGEVLMILENELGLGMLGERRPTEADAWGTGRGSVVGALQTLDGTEVQIDIELWQRGTPHQAICDTITTACSPLPGHVSEAGTAEPDETVARLEVGARAGLVLRIGAPGQPLDRMDAALARVAEALRSPTR